jgi:hypothetical protein
VDGGATRNRVEQRSRVGVLLVHPRGGLFARGVFQLAIRIFNATTVQFVEDYVTPSIGSACDSPHATLPGGTVAMAER